MQHPRLWWPVGYGEPNLYDAQLSLHGRRGSLGLQVVPLGVRQFGYTEDGGALRIFINGRRFVGRGGNWGFSESNLLYRDREYEAAVRYHRDMGFTMIRNWVGQVGDDAFFDACDRNGVVVWQDFWLANPADGPARRTMGCSFKMPATSSTASATTLPWGCTAGATRGCRHPSSTKD